MLPVKLRGKDLVSPPCISPNPGFRDVVGSVVEEDTGCVSQGAFSSLAFRSNH